MHLYIYYLSIGVGVFLSTQCYLLNWCGTVPLNKESASLDDPCSYIQEISVWRHE